MNVAIYCRVSTLEQAEKGYSLKAQEESLKAYAKSLNYKVLKVYRDPGYSGANMNRPGLQNLIANADGFDAVLVFKLDRLSRSQKDTLKIVEEKLLPQKCNLISISEAFDTSTPFGKAMIGILSVFAQLERENIKERLTLGKRAKAKKGGYNGGNGGWGYDYINNKLIPNENAGDIKLAYKLYMQGYGIPSISKKIPHKSRGQIRGWLQSPIYAGMIKYKDILEKGEHEPIVSWEDFCKVQEILEEKKQPHGAPATKNVLAGLCHCAYCGGTLTRRYSVAKRKDGSKRINEYLVCYSVCKTCRSMIKDENCKGKYHRLSDIFLHVKNEVYKLDYNKELFAKQEKKEVEIDYSDRINHLKKKLEKMIDLFLDGLIDKDIYIKRKKVIDDEIYELEKVQLKSINDKPDYSKYLKDLKESFDVLSNVEINTILRILIKDIIISNETVEIQRNFWLHFKISR